MATANSISITATEGKSVTLPKVFTDKPNKQLLAQAVRVFLGNQRSAAAHTKTRSFVNRTTKKMYKQKGTGNARHGSAAAPGFVGGGVAFGPTGEQNYTLSFPTAMRRMAVKSALAKKAFDKKVLVVTEADKASGKTAQVAKIIPSRSLVVASAKEENFVRACRNLPQVQVTYANQLNTYSVLTTHNLVISDAALAEITKLYV